MGTARRYYYKYDAKLDAGFGDPRNRTVTAGIREDNQPVPVCRLEYLLNSGNFWLFR